MFTCGGDRRIGQKQLKPTHLACQLFLALIVLANVATSPLFADDDGDPGIPPQDPGDGYVGIYPNPTLPPNYHKDQTTSPWGVTSMYNATYGNRLGQKFTAGASSIDWAGFVFQATNQGGSLGPAEYRVRIAQSIDSDGHLIDVLGTSSSQTIHIGDTGWFLFQFPTSIPLTSGTSYYLAIDYVSGYTGGPGGTGIGVGGRTNSVYSGGHFTGYWDSIFGTVPFTSMHSGRDLIFATGVATALLGDTDGDLDVDFDDFLAVNNFFGDPGPSSPGDADDDGDTDFDDFLAVNNFFTTTPPGAASGSTLPGVPEPTSILLLGVAASAAMFPRSPRRSAAKPGRRTH